MFLDFLFLIFLLSGFGFLSSELFVSDEDIEYFLKAGPFDR